MSKVIIGISGGVDSSVAAYLLKKEGYEVIGVTFKFTNDFNENDAIDVCKKLNIEHHIIDYREIFKEKIINTFINDYKKGITPNPCVLCNKEIKINYLYKAMKDYNCDFFATGHYAKIIDGKLYRSNDLNKDQTYFLSQVSKEQLNKLLLPLEGITKDKVREIASEIGLLNANKKDSFDVCFINDSFNKFIQKEIENNPGNIVNIKTNEIIGTHLGLNNYTIGQRKNVGISGHSERHFVVGKDIAKNILYVDFGNIPETLLSDSCIINNVNFISNDRPVICTAKFRYRSLDYDVKLEYLENNEILVKYSNNVSSVTPGQVCVLYLNNECIGSGIIKEVRKNNNKLWYL